MREILKEHLRLVCNVAVINLSGRAEISCIGQPVVGLMKNSLLSTALISI